MLKSKTKSNTPSWVFFTFFKLNKWYQIAQNITNIFFNASSQTAVYLS